MFDVVVRILEEVKYAHVKKKYLISVDVLEAKTTMYKTSNSHQVEFNAIYCSTTEKSSTLERTSRVEKYVISLDVPQDEETTDV